MPRPDQNYKVASFFHIANCHVSVMGRWTGIDGTSRRKNISPWGKIKKRMRERKREAFLMMASSFAFWRFGKLGKRTNWLQGREGAHVVPCHAPVCCRHFSRPEICRPLPSSVPRARLLGPIRRTSVAIRRRRRRLLEKCHLQSAASVGGSAIPRGSLFTSSAASVMMKLNTAFHLARSSFSLCEGEWTYGRRRTESFFVFP